MPFPSRSVNEIQKVFGDYLRESQTHDEDIQWFCMMEPIERDTLAMMQMDLMKHLRVCVAKRGECIALLRDIQSLPASRLDEVNGIVARCLETITKEGF